MREDISIELVDILVDTREYSKHQKEVEWLKRQGLTVEVKLIEGADYVLNAVEGKKPLAIECKTPTDFVGSLKESRLIEQLDLLKQLEDDGMDVAIALIGWLGIIEKVTKWNVTAVSRLIDAIVLTWKIPIIPFPNIKWFLAWVIAKAKSLGSQEEKTVRALRARRREMSVEEEAIYMLEGIVGPKTAISLLNHFGNVRNVVNANEEELMKVEGIGKKTAKRLVEVFNTEFCRTPDKIA